MKPTSRNLYAYALCIASIAAHQAQAADGGNGSIGTIPTNAPPPIRFDLQKVNLNPTFLESYESQLERRLDIAISDSFGWQSTFKWMRSIEQGYSFNAKLNEAGRKSIQRSALNSLRESFVHLPGIADSKDWISAILVGTVARTTQGSINPTAPLPNESQISWWEEMRSNGSVVAGSHMLDGDIFYSNIRFGRLNGQPLGMLFANCHGDPFATRLEANGNISIFLPWNSAATVGCSYPIANLENERELTWSASWSHSLGKNWHDGMLSIGVSTNDHETFARCGVTIPL